MKLAVFCGNQSCSNVESASSGGYKKSLVSLCRELIRLKVHIYILATRSLPVDAEQFLVLRVLLQQIQHHKQAVLDNDAWFVCVNSYNAQIAYCLSLHVQ